MKARASRAIQDKRILLVSGFRRMPGATKGYVSVN